MASRAWAGRGLASGCPAPPQRGAVYFGLPPRSAPTAAPSAAAPPLPPCEGQAGAELSGQAEARASLRRSSSRTPPSPRTCGRCRALSSSLEAALLLLDRRHDAHAGLPGFGRDARGEWLPIGARGEAGSELEGGRGRAGSGRGCTVRGPDRLLSQQGLWPRGAGLGVCAPLGPAHSFV